MKNIVPIEKSGLREGEGVAEEVAGGGVLPGRLVVTGSTKKSFIIIYIQMQSI